MPAKDRHHDAVKRALIKDGWNIAAEQVRLTYEENYFWIDIRAENALDQRIILVDVKELDDVASRVEALANAIGKYELYRMGLDYTEQNIPLYLAVTDASYYQILSTRMGQDALQRFRISLLVFNAEQEKVVLWIP